MISRKTKFLSVAAAAAVLLTTLAVARTVHTPPADRGYAAHEKVMGVTPGRTPELHGHGILTCGATISEQDCETLNNLLPMNLSNPDYVVRAVAI